VTTSTIDWEERRGVPKAKAATDKDKKPPGGVSRRGVATRARLVQAAKEIFERDGFLDARITDIAKRAGVSHGSYYHYFESKEQLFREVAEIQEERLTAPPEDPRLVSAPGESPQIRIEKANRRYLERYRDEASIMGIIEQVSRYDQHINDVRMARFKLFAERSEKAIRRWQQEGGVDPGIDPEFAADALGAMVARFAELWLVQSYREYDFDHAVEQLTRLWNNALQLTDEPPSVRSPRRRSPRA
jgi:AcrR family transcriptional regulator